MIRSFSNPVLLAALVLGILSAMPLVAQPNIEPAVDKWVTAEGKAEGASISAQDEAVNNALRKAVEQACGTFLTSESKSQDYKLVYDKIFSDTVGYIIEHKVKNVYVRDGITYATVSARVSTQKFEKNWAVIAHTVHQENNPRIIIAVSDADWIDTEEENRSLVVGVVQSKLEDFFLEKGIQLVDKTTAGQVNKRDIVLAGMKDDVQELAALGARFNADVVIYGQVSAKQGGTMVIAGQTTYKFTATLTVRAIRTDSAQVLVSKTFGPVSGNSLQSSGGREKALAKLAEESAPDLLTAVVEAWRKQVNVSRNIRLNISGMDYAAWQTFDKEAKEIRGIKALRLREITEGVANIDVEYEFTTQALADKLSELKECKVKVVEFNPNRLKLKVEE